MVRVLRTGKTVLSMRVTGGTVWPKDRAHFCTQMVTYTQESSTEIELMASGSTCIKTVKGMRDSGETICKMDLEKRSSQMVANMKESLRTLSFTAMANFNLSILEVFERDTSRMVSQMDLAKSFKKMDID